MVGYAKVGLVLSVLTFSGVVALELDETCNATEATLVDGIGLACEVDGLYRLPTDAVVAPMTHGGDPVPIDDLPLMGVARHEPFCVNNDLEPHAVVIYARAHDDVDRYAEKIPVLRNIVIQANTLVHEAGHDTGYEADLRVRCDGDVIAVREAVLPTDKAAAHFGTVTRDLRAMGYASNQVKHWVYYDDPGACWCGGIGTLYIDDRPGKLNWNNGHPFSGALFAVTFGYDSVRIMLHELGHTMGAVQLSAPNSSGALHCNDGSDIMCYRDGGSRSHLYRSDVCWVQVWDCGRDDYFHTDPEPGSYLADHWNIGSRDNKFVKIGLLPVVHLPEPDA